MPDQKGKTATGATCRYVLRHILRSPGKSLLCLLLAAIFMLGLMLIRVSTIRSENELENLYLTTTVTVELVKSTSAQTYDANGNPEIGFVYPMTVDNLTDTGFLSHRYVQSTKKASALVRLDSQKVAVENGAYGFYGESELYGIEYPQEFLSQRNIQGELTFFDGWDESVFRQGWNDWQSRDATVYRVYPAVISQELYDMLQMEEGDLLRVGIEIAKPGNSMQTEIVTTDLTVVGTHPGNVAAVLFPVNSLRAVNGVDMKYDRVILTVDPAKNRQLDEFRTKVSDIITRGGSVPLSAIYWDQELRQAIAPMEQVISFMKALYPVTLGLSFIVAAGIAVLLSLLSAKEAAILRVLGNSTMRCRVILCLQTVLVCAVGLVIGHLGATAMAYVMLPVEDVAGLMTPALGRVGLYLLYTVLGAVGASAVMTGKNPLELLQVKE